MSWYECQYVGSEWKIIFFFQSKCLERIGEQFRLPFEIDNHFDKDKYILAERKLIAELHVICNRLTPDFWENRIKQLFDFYYKKWIVKQKVQICENRKKQNKTIRMKSLELRFNYR
tara:strand:+ start:106 stop:453 length:348 start_codon:yes stop_codon:yes gene_type:complete